MTARYLAKKRRFGVAFLKNNFYLVPLTILFGSLVTFGSFGLRAILVAVVSALLITPMFFRTLYYRKPFPFNRTTILITVAIALFTIALMLWNSPL
jgi:hypothetical protein